MDKKHEDDVPGIGSLFDLLHAQGEPGLVAGFPSSAKDFKDALEELMNRSIQSLQENRTMARRFSENEITSWIKLSLSGTYGLQVSTETASNGHVDLTITSCPLRENKYTTRGESKIWGGQRYVASGVSQLLGYLTGAEVFGFILIYYKDGDMARARETYSKHIVSDEYQCRGKVTQREDSATLESTHLHSGGTEIPFLHFWMNLVE